MLLVACGAPSCSSSWSTARPRPRAGPLEVLLPFVAVGGRAWRARARAAPDRPAGRAAHPPPRGHAVLGARRGRRADPGRLAGRRRCPGSPRCSPTAPGPAGRVWLAVGDRLVRAAILPRRAGREPSRGRGPSTTWRCCWPGRTPTTSSRCSTAPCCGRRWPSASRAARSRPPTSSSSRTSRTAPALLLRGVALNAELAERVRRADDLATELQASRQRLARAREVERRRLVDRARHATTDRLAALRSRGRRGRSRPRPAAGATRDGGPAGAGPGPGRARRAARPVPRDRPRGVPGGAAGPGPGRRARRGGRRPAPAGAADRDLRGRLDWEIESGIYYVAAAAMQRLAGRSGERPAAGAPERSRRPGDVRIDDPAPASRSRTLAVVAGRRRRAARRARRRPRARRGSAAALSSRAWLPDRLEPHASGD